MPPFTSGTVIDRLAKHYPDELWAVRELLGVMKPGMDGSVIESLKRNYKKFSVPDVKKLLLLMPAFTSGTVIDSLAKHYPDELWAVRELLSGMQTGLSNIPVDLY